MSFVPEDGHTIAFDFHEEREPTPQTEEISFAFSIMRFSKTLDGILDVRFKVPSDEAVRADFNRYKAFTDLLVRMAEVQEEGLIEVVLR